MKSFLDLAAKFATPLVCRRVFSQTTLEHGWNILHLLAVKGFDAAARQLLNAAPWASGDVWNAHGLCLRILDDKDRGERTPLAIAAVNGHESVVQVMLEARASLESLDSAGRSAFYCAARNGHVPTIKVLLTALRADGGTLPSPATDDHPLRRRDRGGYHPLQAACLGHRSGTFALLLEADPSGVAVVNNSGENVLHAVCRASDAALLAMLEMVLSVGETLLDPVRKALHQFNAFGLTPLHLAAADGNHRAVQMILERMPADAEALLSAFDNDGISPLTACIKGLADAKELVPENNYVACVKLMLRAWPQACLKCDHSDSGALHQLCHEPRKPALLEIASELLLNGANPTKENVYGWTPLHTLHHTRLAVGVPPALSADLKEMMIAHARAASSQPHGQGAVQRLEALDLQRPMRNVSVEHGAHLRIPKPTRDGVLRGDLTLSGVAAYLVRLSSSSRFSPVPEGKHAPAAFPRVIVLAGAGISVNAGIPDYRSADTGMYAKSETRNLFNLEYILKHPREFYAFIASKFLPVINGRIRPSLTHAFLRLLQDKGLLARVYTQNVDTLESVAGVADDALVHAHGSFKSARCANPQLQFTF